MKHIKLGQEAREKMAAGIKNLSDVVGSTLGPDGKIVFFEREQGPPIATKDGVTAAHLTFMEDEFENMGAGLIKLAAAKTAEDAGDGTTTSTILANYMIQEGVKNMAKGGNSRHIGDGMVLAANAIIASIKKTGKKIKATDKLVKDVAMVASNYDEQASEMIAEVIKKIGQDGVINIIKSMGEDTTMEYRDGMYVNSSFVHPGFINNYERNEVELSNVAIIVTDYEISSVNDVYKMYVPLSTQGSLNYKGGDGVKGGKTLDIKGYLFIARDTVGEGLQTLLKSKVEKGAPFCAVKPPWGDSMIELMEDVAAVVGAHVISENQGAAVEKSNPHEVCGWAEKIVVSSRGMTIIGGAGTTSEVADRVKYIQNRYDEQDSLPLKKKLAERKARLNNGIAQIRVGGPNEPLMKERAFRIEDAKFAVKSALEEGITVGGGVSFIRALSALDKLEAANTEQQIGIEIVREAVKQPIKVILENSGYNEEERYKMISQVVNGTGNEGFNARTKKFEDLFKAGVINPVKVDTRALENAATVTQQFLNTGAVISILKALVNESER